MMKIARLALVAALTLCAGLASAATFNLFQPASGILVGNPNTYVTTAATSSNVIALWSGTCNSSSFLRGDGQCIAIGAIPTGANPTASVGLTAVNGVATTYMRSDGAPALSQSIAPTWTGAHIFTQSPLLQASAPRLRYNATGAGADEKQWAIQIFSTGAFSLNTRTDVDGTGADALTITRTGTAINTFGVNAATFSVNASTATSFGNAASTNTFAGGIIGTLARTNATAPLLLSSATTSLRFNETDGAVDNKQWEWAANGEQLRLGLLSDAGALGGTAILIDRTGTGVDGITFPANAGITVGAPTGGLQGNGTINATGLFVNGVAVGVGSGDAVLANTQTFTGANTFSNTGNNVQATVAQWGWRETGATADEGNWLLRADGDQFSLFTANDAAPTSAQGTVFSVARSGTNASSIDFLTSTVQMTNSGFIIGNSASPRFTLNETDAAADNRLWRIGTSSETLVWGARNDADNAGTDFLLVDRTGTAIDDITLQSDRVLLRSDGSQALDFILDDTQSATDEELWRFRANGAGQLQFGAVNDALSTAVNFMTVDRTAAAIDNVDLFVGASGATGRFGLLPLSTGTTEGNLYGRTTGNANASYIQFRDSAGTIVGYVGDGSTGDNAMYLASSNSNNLRLSSASGLVITTTGGVATIDGQNICRANGTGCPASSTTNQAWGTFNTTASTCTIVGVSSLRSPSCSRTGVGTYTVSWSVGMANTPTCVVSPADNTVDLVTSWTFFNTFSIQVVNRVAGTATDSRSFSFHCMGD